MAVSRRVSHAELPWPPWVVLSRIAPPYGVISGWDSRDAGTSPLGTLIHADGPSALGALGAVALALRECPWLLPVVTLPPEEEPFEPLVHLVSELSDRVAIVHRPAVVRLEADAVVAAVHRRPPAGTDTMSRYVAARLGAPELFEPLHEQFGIALGDAESACRSVATYSRLFARYGRYTARDWRALARLARDVTATESWARDAPTLDRTVNRHARFLLGMSYRTAHELLGWEWVLEQAIRRAGYSSSPGPAGKTRTVQGCNYLKVAPAQAIDVAGTVMAVHSKENGVPRRGGALYPPPGGTP
jgi:hypothetical protein